MNIEHFLLTGFAGFSLVCILAMLFFERKNPASSLVWILVLIFLPVAGFILYMFLGSGFRLTRQKRYQLKAAEDDLYNNHILKHLNLGRSRVFIKEQPKVSRLLTYLKNEGDGTFTDNNNADIFVDGRDMFDRLKQDMREAKRHIHLLFYIFRNDNLGKEIIAILEEKARAGVEVKVMYDSIGTLMARDTMFRGLKKAGGQVMAFSPIFSSVSSHLRLNYRNHRKIAVIDGLIGYVGGMNIGEEYMSCDPKLNPWRDTHLRITGSAVWFLQERFIMDWSYSLDGDPKNIKLGEYFPEPLDTGDIPMQIIASGPDTFESPIKSGMLGMIYSAEKSVYIQTPYFSPDESFADALRIAAHSDVDVRVMIPKVCDYDIIHRTTLGYVREMMEYGVKFPMFNGFIHSKTIVVDGEVASIGSTNITNRSFTLDFEVNAFVYDCDFAQRCVEIFHADEANSVLLEKEYFTKKGLFDRASYNVARLLAPMM